ncbi:MAG: hypothetical protein R6V15_08040, partial [Desulfotignum sp.]
HNKMKWLTKYREQVKQNFRFRKALQINWENGCSTKRIRHCAQAVLHEWFSLKKGCHLIYKRNQI